MTTTSETGATDSGGLFPAFTAQLRPTSIRSPTRSSARRCGNGYDALEARDHAEGRREELGAADEERHPHPRGALRHRKAQGRALSPRRATASTPKTWRAWERKTGVRVGPGGCAGCFAGAAMDDAPSLARRKVPAGLDNSILPWLKQRDISLIIWEEPPATRRSPRVDLFQKRGAQLHPGDPGNPRDRSRRSRSVGRCGGPLAIAGSSCWPSTPLALPQRDGFAGQSDRDVLEREMSARRAQSLYCATSNLDGANALRVSRPMPPKTTRWRTIRLSLTTLAPPRDFRLRGTGRAPPARTGGRSPLARNRLCRTPSSSAFDSN